MAKPKIVICMGSSCFARGASGLATDATAPIRASSGRCLTHCGTMEGVGIATEGILTLGRVLSALEQIRPAEHEPAAARAILERMMRHDRIEFVIGTKVNESHQDPNVPQDLELRRSVVKRIAAALEKNYRKKVTVNYY